jgi:hypothetical protein
MTDERTWEVEPCNVDHMKIWIEALEGSDYPQITGALKIELTHGPTPGFGYCCLGVACEVAAHNGLPLPSKPEPGEERDEEIGWAFVTDRGGQEHLEGSTLPAEVADWLGLETGTAADINPRLPYIYNDNDYDEDDPPKWIVATEANDEAGWDFQMIAAALRVKYGLPAQDPNQTNLPV